MSPHNTTHDKDVNWQQLVSFSTRTHSDGGGSLSSASPGPWRRVTLLRLPVPPGGGPFGSASTFALAAGKLAPPPRSPRRRVTWLRLLVPHLADHLAPPPRLLLNSPVNYSGPGCHCRPRSFKPVRRPRSPFSNTSATRSSSYSHLSSYSYSFTSSNVTRAPTVQPVTLTKTDVFLFPPLLLPLSASPVFPLCAFLLLPLSLPNPPSFRPPFP